MNHLPIITALRIDGEDAFDRAARAARRSRAAAPTSRSTCRPSIDRELGEARGRVHRSAISSTSNQVKFALFERFGVLPGAGDRHLVEFFPGFLTEESEWGKRWGVHLTTIADREARRRPPQGRARQAARRMTEVPTMPSGEMVAPMIDSFLRDKPRAFPLNLPNAGQVPDLPADVVVEAMCIADGRRPARAATTPRAPPVLAEWLRRVVVVAGGDGRGRAHRATATRLSRRCCSTRSRAASTSTTSSR